MLTYLYFFVYYTATLTIDANIWGYQVELFSKSTAQKRYEDCPESQCTITDVSPFEYNVTISKEGYENEFMSMKVSPRRNESIFIELEKKVSIEPIDIIPLEENAAQKIKRLREEKLYYARFQLWDDTLLTLTEDGDQLLVQYNSWDNILEIAKIQRIAQQDLHAEYVVGSKDIFLVAGDTYYIFDENKKKLYELPFQVLIHYIKPALKGWEYLVVTEKGTFRYTLSSGNSEYQYLFHDFIYSWDDIIGILRGDEDAKRRNFDIKEKGNLIIKYTPADKTRKVVYTSFEAIERIYLREENLIITIKGQEYELQNY